MQIGAQMAVRMTQTHTHYAGKFILLIAINLSPWRTEGEKGNFGEHGAQRVAFCNSFCAKTYILCEPTIRASPTAFQLFYSALWPQLKVYKLLLNFKCISVAVMGGGSCLLVDPASPKIYLYIFTASQRFANKSRLAATTPDFMDWPGLSGSQYGAHIVGCLFVCTVLLGCMCLANLHPN